MIKDLEKFISPTLKDNTLLVSDLKIGKVAQAIIDTMKVLETWWNDGDFGKSPHISILVKKHFGLDIENNIIHSIMWENWMKFLDQIEVIDCEVRWAWPNRVYNFKSNYDYLESLVKKYS